MRVHPLNLGHVFGSRTAVIEMLKLTGRYMRGVAFNCWDQGIMTLLAWAGVYNASSATIWGPDEGFIKTIGFSVGGVRDARGRFLNENGLPYALVHQLKPARHIELTQQIRSALPPDRRQCPCGSAAVAWPHRRRGRLPRGRRLSSTDLCSACLLWTTAIRAVCIPLIANSSGSMCHTQRTRARH